MANITLKQSLSNIPGITQLQPGAGLTTNGSYTIVNANTGIVANTLGTFVNSAYIATVTVNSANNADYLDGQHGSYYAANSQLANYALLSGATFSGATTFNANLTMGAADHIVLSSTSGISANGTYGTAGQVLHSNGSAVYWDVDDQGVTSVATANGLSGGTITSTGTLGVVTGSTLTVNTTGIHVNSALSLRDLTLSGNLTVSGTTTYINTTQLNVGDNIIQLNADLGAVAPSENAGIEINRGSSANVQFLWDETNDRWSTNGQPLSVSSLVAAGAASGITTLAAGNTTVTGFANVSSTLQVGGAATFNANVTLGTANHLILSSTSGISANGTYGTAGQMLTSNGSAVYWLTPQIGDITAVTAGSGLTGGGTSGDLTINVGAGTGIIVNADDIAVNSAYIATITANNATYFGGYTWAAPAALGTGTANSGSFTSVTANTYQQRASGIPRVNLGDPTITEMALFDYQFNNKTEFYPPANVICETSTDGVTWSTYSVSDAQKKALVGGDNGASIAIPNGTAYFRVRFVNKGDYVYLNALYLYHTSGGHTSTVQIYKKDFGSTTWVQHTNSTAQVGSWPGHIYLPFSTIAYHPSTYVDEVAVVFAPTWNPSWPAQNITLHHMQIWGGYPAGRRNIYTVDSDKNVTFPAALTATTTLAAGNTTVTGFANVSSTLQVGGVATFNANATLGAAKHLILSSTSGISANGTLGTAGHVLHSNGTAVYWAADDIGVPLTANNTSATTFYLPMSDATTGTWSNGVVSNTKLYFVPSTGTLSATTFDSLSDIAQKTNVKTVDNALDVINSLNGVEFDWVENGAKSSGVIAQELEQVLPHLVSENNGRKTVNYSGIIAYLIEAIKLQNKQIQDLQDTIQYMS